VTVTVGVRRESVCRRYQGLEGVCGVRSRAREARVLTAGEMTSTRVEVGDQGILSVL
jgi:hypothetical protein